MTHRSSARILSSVLLLLAGTAFVGCGAPASSGSAEPAAEEGSSQESSRDGEDRATAIPSTPIVITVGGDISQEGELPEGYVPGVDPAPLGTPYEFLGWRAVVGEAEVTTQPNEAGGPNPVTVVLQMQLTVTAPSPLTEQTVSPFFPQPRWKTLDMPPCFPDERDTDDWSAGEEREVTSCHFFNTEGIGDDLPEGTIVIRYGGMSHTARVVTATTRGPDY